jgi:transposase InsO family protein
VVRLFHVDHPAPGDQASIVVVRPFHEITVSLLKTRPSRFSCGLQTDPLFDGHDQMVLRQQLAVWKARQPRPRLTEMDRIFWVLLSRLWTSWRHSLLVVRPQTVVGWHRQGFRRYWAWKSRRRFGRPAISADLGDLIRRISYANPLWGAPRIHGELLKLGIAVSQAMVSKYMLRPRRPPSQAWRTFLKNHAKHLIALDFFTVPTATFRVLFVLVMLTHSRRRLAYFNVTEHPTAEWTARQLLEACVHEEAPRYLIRDRDQVYGERFSRQARTLDIREVVIAPRSPWQNAYAERVIGSIRRECLDHVVVVSERHLRAILAKYVALSFAKTSSGLSGRRPMLSRQAKERLRRL